MAKRRAPTRETVRVDPPATPLDPSRDLLKLVDPEGEPLIGGGRTRESQYCWVQKSSGMQMAQYGMLGYRICRYAEDEVRPLIQMHTEFEDADARNNAPIERTDVVLMKRPISYYDAEVAANRAKNESRKAAMSPISADDHQRARAGRAVIRPHAPDIEQSNAF